MRFVSLLQNCMCLIERTAGSSSGCYRWWVDWGAAATSRWLQRRAAVSRCHKQSGEMEWTIDKSREHNESSTPLSASFLDFSADPDYRVTFSFAFGFLVPLLVSVSFWFWANQIGTKVIKCAKAIEWIYWLHTGYRVHKGQQVYEGQVI